MKWKHFPVYWPFVQGIHRLPVNSPHKGQWRGAIIFPLNCAWTNTRANNREAGDLRRHRAHYDVTVMQTKHNKVHTESIVQVIYYINFFASHLALGTIINQYINREIYVHIYNMNTKQPANIRHLTLSYTVYYTHVAAIFCWWKQQIREPCQSETYHHWTCHGIPVIADPLI